MIRTSRQNKILHGLLAQLGLYEQKNELALQYSNGRTDKTAELSVDECQALISQLQMDLKGNKTMVREQQRQNSSPLDLARKRVIAAIHGWYKLQGKTATTEYVKATACQAAGRTDSNFNLLSISELRRIYSEFMKKEATAHNVNKLKQKAIADATLKPHNYN